MVVIITLHLSPSLREQLRIFPIFGTGQTFNGTVLHFGTCDHLPFGRHLNMSYASPHVTLQSEPASRLQSCTSKFKVRRSGHLLLRVSFSVIFMQNVPFFSFTCRLSQLTISKDITSKEPSQNGVAVHLPFRHFIFLCHTVMPLWSHLASHTSFSRASQAPISFTPGNKLLD